jgi:ABC-2 type transport system permease protein
LRSVATLTRRELRSFFLAPSSYLVLGLFLFLTGYFFRFVLAWAGGDLSVTYRTLASSIYFQLFLGVLPPLVTMRSLAAERASGTLEMLLTAPVTDRQVVISKFLGAYGFFAALWLPTLLYPLAIRYLGGQPDPGQVAAFTLGILVVGALLVSVGLFCSSITDSVLVAFFLGFVVDAVLLFGIGGLVWLAPSPEAREAFRSIHVAAQLDDFARGIVDLRHLVFHVTGTALFLFLTIRSLESRRWR